LVLSAVFGRTILKTQIPVARFFYLTLLLLILPAAALHAAPEEAGALRRILNTDQSEAKRVEALRALEMTGEIDAQQIVRSICDTSPVIRAEMVRLGTRMAATDSELELRLVALAHDRNPIVKMQMLKSLPQFPSPRAAAAFQKALADALASKHAGLRALAESLRKSPPSAGTP
jgi:hypothetical protein